MKSDHVRAILAVVLSGVVLLVWQFYFAPQIPKQMVNSEIVSSTPQERSSDINKPQSEGQDGSQVVTPPGVAVKVDKKIEKMTISSTNKKYDVIFDNKFTIHNMINRNKVKYDFISTIGEAPFSIKIKREGDIQFQDLYLNFHSVNNELFGKNEDLGIVFKGILDDDGRFTFNFESTNLYQYRFVFKTNGKQLENNQIREFIFLNDDVERETIGDGDMHGVGDVHWAGIDFNYHMFALVFHEKISLVQNIVDINNADETTKGIFGLNTTKPLNKLSGYLIYELKEYDLLKKLGDRLDLAIDFGIFGIIAIPILKTLQFFYGIIPNYGVSIIILTFIMRLALFPLQQKSFKSMKKMQALQPELNKLKEKYKDEPAKIQKETMALFKKEGANPLGGCLPLLLQMPIFIAMYRVLYSSVELVGAPFILQIQDLSAKDPYYIIPVLMGAAMFIQQSMTPMSNVDATQQKVMKYGLPILFTFIMKDLASGLVLYIFVSTLFGLIQQLYVNKLSKSS